MLVGEGVAAMTRAADAMVMTAACKPVAATCHGCGGPEDSVKVLALAALGRVAQMSMVVPKLGDAVDGDAGAGQCSCSEPMP